MDDRSAAYQLYVGLAVAADSLTAAWLPVGGTPSPAFAADQAPAGYATLQRRLRGTAVAPAATLVVLEATGNYMVSSPSRATSRWRTSW